MIKVNLLDDIIHKTLINQMSRDIQNHPSSYIQPTSNSLRAKKDQLTESVQAILNKLPELRTNQDALILNKFIHKSTFFTHLMETFSLDLAKNVLKHAHIHEIAKNRVIASKNSNIERVIIFISGKTALVDGEGFDSEKQDEGVPFYLNQMLEKSTNIARDIKRKIKEGREDPHQLAEFKTSKAAMFQLKILKKYQEEQIFNIKALADGQKYTETLVTVAPSIILSISAKIFYQMLAAYMKKKKSDKISAFRKFQYFNQIENEKLIKIVDQMPMMTMKKGKVLYKEGQPFDKLYLLISGGIKITKNVDLFRENPNFLFVDRNKLKNGTASILPYADFSEVYNYKPKSKPVQLGIISQMGIFGEEQLFSETNIRQVTAQVATQSAVFYIISLQKLQAALQQKKTFIAELKQGLFKNQTENKILYRQEKLSQLLMCENKNNMDYFFIQQGAKLQTNRKFKIGKVNNLISPQKSPQKKNSQSVSSAFYNTFNFTKLPRSSKDSRRQSQFQMTDEQSKILDLIHTVDNSKPKTSGSQVRRKKINSSHNFSIDIKNPLFQLGYFEKKRKQELRIEKESRMRPLASSAKRSSRASSSMRQKWGETN